MLAAVVTEAVQRFFPDSYIALLTITFIALVINRTDLPVAVMVAPGAEGTWRQLEAGIPRHRGGMLPAMPLPEALGVTTGARALVTVDKPHALRFADSVSLTLEFDKTDNQPQSENLNEHYPRTLSKAS